MKIRMMLNGVPLAEQKNVEPPDLDKWGSVIFRLEACDRHLRDNVFEVTFVDEPEGCEDGTQTSA